VTLSQNQKVVTRLMGRHRLHGRAGLGVGAALRLVLPGDGLRRHDAGRRSRKATRCWTRPSVRFDASLARDMPWTFRPVEPHMDVRIGETGLAFYEAYNPTDRPVAGTASFNVAPSRPAAIS
jgi:hypothetical protein